MSEAATRSGTEPLSTRPCVAARSLVSGERPSLAHITGTEASPASTAPMAPGWRIPTFMAATLDVAIDCRERDLDDPRHLGISALA